MIDEIAMGNEGWICDKDLRLKDRNFQRQGKELWKERSEILSFEMRGRRERQKWSEERVLTVCLILMTLRW